MPVFGMAFSRPADEPVPVLGADFSKMLLIETSEDADASVFPIGTPVRFSTSDTTKVGKLGTGLLADAVKGINAQLTGVNRGADVTVIRVAEGANVAATAANIVAALGTVTSVPSVVNATPRLIWAGRTAFRPADGEDGLLVNPVIAALNQACSNLLAIAVVDVDDTATAKAIDARETMNSQRLMPVVDVTYVRVVDHFNVTNDWRSRAVTKEQIPNGTQRDVQNVVAIATVDDVGAVERALGNRTDRVVVLFAFDFVHTACSKVQSVSERTIGPIGFPSRAFIFL